jgi:hypothetical protein
LNRKKVRLTFWWWITPKRRLQTDPYWARCYSLSERVSAAPVVLTDESSLALLKLD